MLRIYGGESLHGLPSLGLTDPPAAAGNKEYVIKFLGPRISCQMGTGPMTGYMIHIYMYS